MSIFSAIKQHKTRTVLIVLVILFLVVICIPMIEFYLMYAASDIVRKDTQDVGNGGYYFDYYENRAVLVQYSGTASSLTIPSTSNGLPVTEIASGAFAYSPNLQSIIIPEGVETIQGSSFANCDKLSQITIPSSVKSMGGAFSDTPWWKLQTNEFVIINGDLLKYNGSAEHVIIPEGVQRIENNVFYQYRKGEPFTVTLPASLKEIGSAAFADTALNSIAFPTHLCSIGANAFCLTGLSVLDFPASLDYVGWDAFDSTPWAFAQTDEFVIINGNLLMYQGNADIMVVPDGVRYLNLSTCFQGSTVILPDSVIQIDSNCFANCPALVNIQLSANLKKIGARAFSNCPMLSSISLPNGLECIEDSAFDSCSSLTKIVLPDSVRYIGRRSFVSCSSLQSITFSNDLGVIPYLSFCHCNALNQISGGSTIQYVANEAFSDCPLLKGQRPFNANTFYSATAMP